MTPLELRLEALKKELVGSPEKMALIVRLTVDTAALQARALAGEDVEKELAFVRASAANLDENARQLVGRHLMGFATEILSKALGVAVATA